MKIFVILLSFYFLGLNAVPCDDGSGDSEPQQEIQLQEEMEHKPNNAVDTCTPFCQCHCCHVHVVDFQKTSSEEAIEPVISTLIVQKGADSGEEIPYLHFQPPRV